MSNIQVSKKITDSKITRIDNRFLYFLAFKLPLDSSYSNRTLVNYFDVLIASGYTGQQGHISFFDSLGDITTLHNLVINSVFKLYL